MNFGHIGVEKSGNSFYKFSLKLTNCLCYNVGKITQLLGYSVVELGNGENCLCYNLGKLMQLCDIAWLWCG